MDISGTECARARESVSADLDRELNELDLRRLQAHVRACADCSSWAASVRAATIELRAAPLEEPAVASFAVPRRGRSWRVAPALAIAPAAALAAAVVAVLGAQHAAPATSTSLTTDNQVVYYAPGDAQARVEQRYIFRAV